MLRALLPYVRDDEGQPPPGPPSLSTLGPQLANAAEAAAMGVLKFHSARCLVRALGMLCMSALRCAALPRCRACCGTLDCALPSGLASS